MELKYYFAVIYRWWWVAALCALLAGLAGYVFARSQVPVYESRARFLVGSIINSAEVRSDELRTSSQAGQTYRELATSQLVLEQVVDTLALPLTPEQLAKQILPAWNSNSQILTIRAQADNPQTAAQIANTVGEAMMAISPEGPSGMQTAQRIQANARIAELESFISATQIQVEALVDQIQQTNDPDEQRSLIVVLDQRRDQLDNAKRELSEQRKIARGSSPNQLTQIDIAQPDPIPIDPVVSRVVLAALIAGLGLGVAAILLLEYLNDKIYTPDNLHKTTSLRYVGGIRRHRFAFWQSTPRLAMLSSRPTPITESYRILSTNIQLLDTNHSLQSLLICSPTPGSNTYELTANLAIAFAQAGKRVTLIDASYGRSPIISYFNLDRSAMLAAIDHPPSEGPMPIPAPQIPRLGIVPSVVLQAYQEAIKDFPLHRAAIQRLSENADIVIVNGPPLPSADALLLARHVDAVLLVARSGVTRQIHLNRAVESLELIQARIIGVALEGVRGESLPVPSPSRMARPAPQSTASQANNGTDPQHAHPAASAATNGYVSQHRNADEPAQLRRLKLRKTR